MQYTTANCQQLNQFYKRNKDKARAKPQDLMYAAINDAGQTCAALRLLEYDNFLFLRSVLTANDYRGQGIASQLIRYALAQSSRTQSSRTQSSRAQSSIIYTLPTPLAVPLYQRLGFIAVPQAEIPPALLASYRRLRQGDKGARVMVIDSRLG